MAYSSFEIPDQNISDKKKDKKWHIFTANKMIEYLTSKSHVERVTEINKLEKKYAAEPVDRPHVTQPYGDKLPMEYEVYPLIEGMIDDLIGKYLSRPIPKKAYSINRDAINSKLDAKVELITEDLIRGVNEKISKNTGVEVQSNNPGLDIPEDIEEFMSKNYKTLAEEISDDLIKQFLDVNRNKEKIKELLTEYLYGETCAGYIGEKNGHPDLKVIRYDEGYYDVDPETEVQRDMNALAYYKYHTENEIYNKYNLSKKDKENVKQAFRDANSGDLNLDVLDSLRDYDVTFQNCPTGVSYNGWMENTDSKFRLRVLTMRWKSKRTIRILKYKDKTTKKQKSKVLPHSYKRRRRDNIEEITFDTLHYVKMLGPTIVLDWGEIQNRNERIDNPSKAYILGVGLVGRNYIKSGKIRSVAGKLSTLQTFASDIYFQMRLATNNMDGRVMLYDYSQIPKQLLKKYGEKNALNKVLSIMKKTKLVPFNGADKHSNFNQFSAQDLSNKGLFQELIDGLLLVEELARKHIGLTKEATEGAERYQTATSVNRSVTNSSTRMEVYFFPFDNLIGELFNKVLQKSKEVYEKGQVFNQIFGDLQSRFFVVHREFWDADIGLFIGDSSKDIRDKQIIDMGAQQALGNAQDIESILNLIEVLEKDSASESKAVLERTVVALKKLEKENLDRQSQSDQAALDDKQAERDHESKENKLDRDKDIKVAKIRSNDVVETTQMQTDSSDMQKAADIENDMQKEQQSNSQPQQPQQQPQQQSGNNDKGK